MSERALGECCPFRWKIIWSTPSDIDRLFEIFRRFQFLIFITMVTGKVASTETTCQQINRRVAGTVVATDQLVRQTVLRKNAV